MYSGTAFQHCGVAIPGALCLALEESFERQKRVKGYRPYTFFDDAIAMVELPGHLVLVPLSAAGELWLLANLPEGHPVIGNLTFERVLENPWLPGDHWIQCGAAGTENDPAYRHLCAHHELLRATRTADACLAEIEDLILPSNMTPYTVRAEMVPQRLRQLALRANGLANQVDPPEDPRVKAVLTPLKALTWQIYGLMLIIAAVAIIPALKLLWKAIWWTP